jgi:hypothetical protein
MSESKHSHRQYDEINHHLEKYNALSDRRFYRRD